MAETQVAEKSRKVAEGVWRTNCPARLHVYISPHNTTHVCRHVYRASFEIQEMSLSLQCF